MAASSAMPSATEFVVPGDLLRAIAERSGRVTFVLGAGCSVEAPTGLDLASVYSKAAFDQLVADGEIEASECSDPWDLSVLASAVFAKFGDQGRVVNRLPRNDFLYAKANPGYLVLAALLAEGAVSCVATLNYDLALTDAVRNLDARGVNQIAGPTHLADFGSSAIVYLHRNVNEQDLEKWILRKDALEDEWKDGWESVVAARIATSPVVVFAGLGSPAAVLTDAVTRIRSLVPDSLFAYLADPSETSAFASALDLPPGHHIQAYWGAFMWRLGERLAHEFAAELRTECQAMVEANGWADNDGRIENACSAYKELGLIGIGRLRARWLLADRTYEPGNDAHSELLADLVLGIGLLCGSDSVTVRMTEGGPVVLSREGYPNHTVVPVSGRGSRRWSQLDPVLAERVAALDAAPDLILVAGVQGQRPAEWAPPADIVAEYSADDVVSGVSLPRVVSIDELRSDPGLLAELVM